MKTTWDKGDKIIFTYPVESGGNTYEFVLDGVRGDGDLTFLSGGGGGLTLTPAMAQAVREANSIAQRMFDSGLLERQVMCSLAYLISNNPTRE